MHTEFECANASLGGLGKTAGSVALGLGSDQKFCFC